MIFTSFCKSENFDKETGWWKSSNDWSMKYKSAVFLENLGQLRQFYFFIFMVGWQWKTGQTSAIISNAEQLWVHCKYLQGTTIINNQKL